MVVLLTLRNFGSAERVQNSVKVELAERVPVFASAFTLKKSTEISPLTQRPRSNGFL